MLKNKFLKFIIRVLILFIITVLVFIVMVTQPVLIEKDLKPALAKVNHLKNHVYHLSQTIVDDFEIGDRLELSAESIFSQFSQYSESTHYQDFDVQGVLYRNIVVDIKGKSQCGTYIIGAHYDTYGDLPGSDDNSSGVAGLIEIVRMYSINKPKCDMQFVAYTLEEPPYFRSEYMGSYIHAKSLFDNNIDVKAMISLEMIGYFDDEIGSQNYPFKGMEYLYSDKGDFISLVGNM